MLLRRVGAVLIGLAGALACLLAIASGAGIAHTTANAEKLDRQFRQASTAIETFRRSSGRLPSAIELDGLLHQKATDAYGVVLMPNGFDQCDRHPERYRRMAEGGYVLAAWRGGWWECFSSSANESTLALDPNEFAWTGSVIGDRFALGLFALANFALVAWLWRRRRVAANGAAGED